MGYRASGAPKCIVRQVQYTIMALFFLRPPPAVFPFLFPLALAIHRVAIMLTLGACAQKMTATFRPINGQSSIDMDPPSTRHPCSFKALAPVCWDGIEIVTFFFFPSFPSSGGISTRLYCTTLCTDVTAGCLECQASRETAALGGPQSPGPSPLWASFQANSKTSPPVPLVHATSSPERGTECLIALPCHDSQLGALHQRVHRDILCPSNRCMGFILSLSIPCCIASRSGGPFLFSAHVALLASKSSPTAVCSLTFIFPVYSCPS